MQGFTSIFEQLMRGKKKPPQNQKTQNPGSVMYPKLMDTPLHHYTMYLLYCMLHYEGEKQPHKMTCQQQRPCIPNTVTVCCRNNFQASGASSQAIAHLHSKNQPKLLQQ